MLGEFVLQWKGGGTHRSGTDLVGVSNLVKDRWRAGHAGIFISLRQSTRRTRSNGSLVESNPCRYSLSSTCKFSHTHHQVRVCPNPTSPTDPNLFVFSRSDGRSQSQSHNRGNQPSAIIIKGQCHEGRLKRHV